MQKPANKFSVNIIYFMLLATLALVLMGTILTKPASNDLNGTAEQLFAESSATKNSTLSSLPFSNPGALLRANTIKY